MGMSSAATIQSESPSQEPYTGSPASPVDSWQGHHEVPGPAPASIMRRGRFTEGVAWRGRCSACWSKEGSFWNVPGPGVSNAQRLFFPRSQQCDQLRRCAFLGRAFEGVWVARPAEACCQAHLLAFIFNLLTLGKAPCEREAVILLLLPQQVK